MRSLSACSTLLASVLLAACTGQPIGDPCIPERVPPGGFVAAETYLETGSVDCETRLCMVRGLDGDPRRQCDDGTCPSETMVRDHVYCTAACAADVECPEGFVCVDVGAGSFCARDLPPG